MHLARILEGTSYPADMKDRIQQVAGVVPNKSEEEICVALHDHDYDPEKAITSLLDADANQVRLIFMSALLKCGLIINL